MTSLLLRAARARARRRRRRRLRLLVGERLLGSRHVRDRALELALEVAHVRDLHRLARALEIGAGLVARVDDAAALLLPRDRGALERLVVAGGHPVHDVLVLEERVELADL